MEVGFCWVDCAPLPKSHCQAVGDPVLSSVKLTANGAQPLSGLAEKAAVNWLFAIEHNETNTIHKKSLVVKRQVLVTNSFFEY